MATTPQPPAKPPGAPTPAQPQGQPHHEQPTHQSPQGTGSQPGQGAQAGQATVRSGGGAIAPQNQPQQPTPGSGQQGAKSKREQEIEAGQAIAKKNAEAALALATKQAEDLVKARELQDAVTFDDIHETLRQDRAEMENINLAGVMPPSDHMAEGQQPYISDATRAEMDTGRKANEDWAKRRQAELDAGKKLVQGRAGQGS